MTPYYSRDGIVIYHADCRDVLPTLEPSTVDLVLTDPPYGIGWKTDYRSKDDGMNPRRHSWPSKQHAPIHGDDEPFDPAPLIAYGKCVLFGANNYADKLPPSNGWLVWSKTEGQPPDSSGDCELAWTNITGAVRRYRHLWHGYQRQSEIGKHIHPTQKPVALFLWILGQWTKPGDLILDPYMGSGPVAAACHQLGRKYIGIEIEERYCEIAVKRLQQAVLPLTG